MTKIKMGLIGLGGRGLGLYEMVIGSRDNVEIVAVADRYQDRADAAVQSVAKFQDAPAMGTTDHREVLNFPGIDCVLVATDWNTHLSVSMEALEKGIAVACEVGGAYSINELWDLVKVHERTKTPFMLMENCCYGRDELMALNMIRQGVLGKVVYASGGYLHDLRDEITLGKENRHYRLENYRRRNAENYPTHELGPIAKIANINRGNRLLTVSSFGSKPGVGLEEYVRNTYDADHALQGESFAQSDIVVTNITCADGTLITLKLDTTLPRYYSRGFTIQGTKGMFNEDNHSIFLDDEHAADHFTWRKQWGNIDDYREKYEHPIWKQYLEEGVRAGHGGMDWLVFSAFFEALEKGKDMPVDVYDAATWMSITALSEESLALGGHPVAVPDFTNGLWINRQPADFVI